MMAGSRHVRHFTSRASGDDRPDLDHIVGRQFGIAGNEGPVSDDQMRLASQTELGQKGVHSPTADDLDLAAGMTEDDLHGRRRLDGASARMRTD